MRLVVKAKNMKIEGNFRRGIYPPRLTEAHALKALEDEKQKGLEVEKRLALEAAKEALEKESAGWRRRPFSGLTSRNEGTENLAFGPPIRGGLWRVSQIEGRSTSCLEALATVRPRPARRSPAPGQPSA